MFCPVCQAEYRPGFYRCADCDVDLVDTLSREQESTQPSQLFDPRTIWIGDGESYCVSFCKDLQRASIPYAVSQLLEERRQRGDVRWRFEIAVSADDEQRAKELLQLPEKVVEWNSEASEEDENQVRLEYPEIIKPDSDETRRRRDYLKPLYPEDASVEVLGIEPGLHNQVAASLRENYIRVHVESQPDGPQRLFVLPEDQAAAREIAREIAQDSPNLSE